MIHIVKIGDGAGDAPSADIIGGKAAGLATLAALGLSVPSAFVLPIELCARIVRNDSAAENQMRQGLHEGVCFLEETTGKRFGDRRNPLLVSVRSGAAQSMPGMLDTVLNVGCSANATRGLIRTTGNPRFAWDCRRRFLESYAETALGLDPAPFQAALRDLCAREDALTERDLDSEAMERLTMIYRELIADAGAAAPEDAREQLVVAAHAVYRSWISERACVYRKLNRLDHLAGTAVTVQAMVFGNRGLQSGAGVAISRDPSTGAHSPIIDVLIDAQGEDVVSGRRTPETEEAMTSLLPSAAAELRTTLTRLERHFRDIQDVEFTIEEGRLWILQTRSAKRTPRAALRCAIDLVREGLITRVEALLRLKDLDVQSLASTRFVGSADPIAWGVGVSGGVAAGRAAFDSDAAERLAAPGERVILLRPDTNTSDVAGFAAACGVVTASGGRTAHAALVARQMAKPCVVGCAALSVDVNTRHAHLADLVIAEGDWLSIDGGSGGVYLGKRDIIMEAPTAELAEIASWREGGIGEEQLPIALSAE
jgi:pyruvate, orthophosphate dikinase